MKENFEKYAYGVIHEYQKKLLLDKHTFELKFNKDMGEALMACVFNYPYLNVTIRYGERAIEKWKAKEDVVPYIVHEMCHPITDPLYSKSVDRYASKTEIEDEREKLTDYICNIVLKLSVIKKGV